MIRSLLALVVIVAACWSGCTYSEHHTATNDNAFIALYKHLEPAPLVVPQHADEGAGEHGAAAGHGAGRVEYLFALPIPGWPGRAASYPEGESAGFPAVLDGDPHSEGFQLVATNLQIFQVAAALLVLILFSGVASHVRNGGGDWWSRKLAGFAMWVRDEMVYPNMGEELGRKFLPWFLCIFFFILFMNLLGLVPWGATATANIFVTAALALITLTSMIVCGMYAQGPIAFWKNLVPHVPLALWPLMFVVEVIGLLVKPFALMIRLFANMTGGHLVVLSFMGLIFFFQHMAGDATAWAVSPVALGFAVFIMIIEGFVAMLQAYIFTQLSILFVGASVYPEH